MTLTGQTVVFPKDSAVLQQTEIELVWNPVNDYQELFDVQVASEITFSNVIYEVQGLDTNRLYVPDLESGNRYFWRVNSDNGEWSPTWMFDVFYPIDNQGLVLWLRADSMVTITSGTIDSIGDISGNGNTFFQNTSSKRPVLLDSWFNNRPAIEFDGINDWLAGTGWQEPASNFSFTFVSDKVDDSEARMLFITAGLLQILSHRADGLYSDGVFQGPSLESTDPQFLTLNLRQQDSSDVWIGLEDVAHDLGWAGNPIGSTISLGSRVNQGGTFFDGTMAELIVYNHGLTPSEQHLINGYLQSRYSPPIDLGEDIILNSFCDTVVRVDGDRFIDVQWSDGSSEDSMVISGSGEYWVTGMDPFGVWSTDTIRVIRPGEFIDSFTMCYGLDSLWDTGLDPLEFIHTWNVPDMGSSILMESGGSYELTINDMSGCEINLDPVIVEIDSFPIQVSLGPDIELCLGNSISLVQGGEEAVDYLWNNVEGGESLPIDASGLYVVEVLNEGACLGIDSVEVTIIGEAPSADFGFTNLCFEDLSQFVDNSQAPAGDVITEWFWDFGDGESSSLSNPQHSYQLVDTFIVALTVGTDIGCSETLEQSLVISPLPSMSYNIGPACSGQEVLFSNTSEVNTGFVAETEWLFNESDVVSETNSNYLFSNPGLYPVRLVSSTNKGCRDTLEFEVEVLGSPVSIFTAEPVCAPEESFFVASPDTTLSGAVNQYSWDFGGGEMVNNIFPQMVNQLPPGLNPVELTVTALNGCSDDTTQFVLVGQDPVADFSISSACVGLPVEFYDESEVLEGDTVQAWTWFFSDGEQSSLQNPSFTYNEVGSYEVSLNVESQLGCASQILQEVIVSPIPIASFSFSPNIGLAPITPVFENFSEGATEFLWTFDLGATSNAENPVHTFLDSGLVEITLLVMNEAGCSAESSDFISLTEPTTDIALLELGYGLDEDFVIPQLQLLNLSNYDLEGLVFEHSFVGGPVFQESWAGIFPRNEIMTLELNTSVALSTLSGLPILCTEVIPLDNRLDIDESNNRLCISIDDPDGDLVVLGPWPNPASDVLSFSIIRGQGVLLKYQIIDVMGRVIIDSPQIGIDEIVSSQEIALGQLNPGEYILQLRFGEDRIENFPFFKVGR